MILPFEGTLPSVAPDAFVAPNAAVIGAVTLGPGSSVWYSAVLRADIHRIEIGAGTNVQDGAVIHVAGDRPALLGRNVTVGHGAIIHAAEIGDGCLVGMGATILDGAVVGARTLVAAGALVTPNTRIPEGSLVVGSPAKVKRPLTPEEIAGMADNARRYVELAAKYRAEAAR